MSRPGVTPGAPIGAAAFTSIAIILLTAFGAGCRQTAERDPVEPVGVTAGDESLRVSGPYAHDNLSVYLLHGKDRTGQDFITLDEGLASGRVVLSEQGADGTTSVPPATSRPGQVRSPDTAQTEASSAQTLQIEGNFSSQSIQQSAAGATVNTLVIENLDERPLYIQAGDIVKGGKQDRAIAVDIVIAPRSGKVPIDAFCVESGRWRSRQADVAGGTGLRFTEQSFKANTRELKLAIRRDVNQSDVWNAVRNAQVALSGNIDKDVSATASPTSYQLSLEDGNLATRIEQYTTKLASLVEQHDDAIGFAFAINGKLNSVDVYASRGLFLKLWPKTLEAAATEAIAELGGEKAARHCTAADVIGCMRTAESGTRAVRDVAEGVQNVSLETDEVVAFETVVGEGTVRRNFLTKR